MGKRAAAKEEPPCPSPKAARQDVPVNLQVPAGYGPPIPDEAMNVNGPHYATVVAALEKIKRLKHERKFLPLCDPLPIANGGRISPYDPAQFDQCMRAGHDYTCGCSIFAASVHDMVSPGVPIMVGHVQKYMEHKFSDVRTLVPPTVVIGVDAGQDPTQCRQGLTRVTAPEPVHALLYPFRIYDDDFLRKHVQRLWICVFRRTRARNQTNNEPN